jgi:hypothetical protein
MQDKPEKSEKPKNQDITLTIGTPKGSFTAVFPKTAKVQDVIETAIKKMHLDGALDAFEVFHGEEQLTPITRTLESFHLKDGDKLLIAATGSGV